MDNTRENEDYYDLIDLLPSYKYKTKTGDCIAYHASQNIDKTTEQITNTKEDEDVHHCTSYEVPNPLIDKTTEQIIRKDDTSSPLLLPLPTLPIIGIATEKRNVYHNAITDAEGGRSNSNNKCKKKAISAEGEQAVIWAESQTIDDIVLTEDRLDVHTLDGKEWGPLRCYVKLAFMKKNNIVVPQFMRKDDQLGKVVSNHINPLDCPLPTEGDIVRRRRQLIKDTDMVSLRREDYIKLIKATSKRLKLKEAIHEIKSREADIVTRWRYHLIRKDEQIDSLLADIKEFEINGSACSHEIDRLRDEIAMKDTQLVSINKEAEIRVSALSCEIAEIGYELAEKDKELASKDRDLVRKDIELASKDSKIAKLRGELAVKDKEIISINKEAEIRVSALSCEIAEIGYDLADKVDELSSKDEDIRDLSNSCKSLRIQQLLKDELISTLKRNKDEDTQMKDETIVSKDKVISEMNKDISSKEAEIIKLRDELASHDKVGTQLETEIAPEESLNTVELVGRDMLLLTVKEEIISSNYEKFEEAESELQTSMDTEDSMDEDDDDFMIQCDAPNCGKWVSALDLSPPITPQQADEYEKYHCDECIPYHGPSTLYTRRSGLRMMKRIHYGNERESKYTECRSRGTNGFEAKVRAMSLSEAIPFRIAEKNTELASNNKEIEYKENEIARLRELEAQLKSDLNKQHSEIEAKEEAIKSKEDAISRLKFDLRNKRSSTRMSIQEKDKQIASLKAEIASLTTVCPPFKRRRTGHQPKVLTLQLGHEYSSCGICHSKYSTDTKNKDNDVKKHLPVISASSKSCDHCFCHGCILKQQAAIAEENGGKVPKWIPCMVCRTKTAFCPSEPKYHRMLIDILKQAKWADNEAEVKVKEEAKPNNNDEIPARDEMLLSMKEYEEGTAEEVQGYHF